MPTTTLVSAETAPSIGRMMIPSGAENSPSRGVLTPSPPQLACPRPPDYAVPSIRTANGRRVRSRPSNVNGEGDLMADNDDRYQRGREVILSVWGQEQGSQILQRWQDLSPDLERQIVEYMYADRWALEAPAPDLKTRSLVQVAALVAVGRATQLRVHLIGALRNGASEREIVETVLQVGLLAGFPTSWDALGVCNEVFADYRAQSARGTEG